jgi:hypothetical protein
MRTKHPQATFLKKGAWHHFSILNRDIFTLLSSSFVLIGCLADAVEEEEVVRDDSEPLERSESSSSSLEDDSEPEDALDDF